MSDEALTKILSNQDNSLETTKEAIQELLEKAVATRELELDHYWNKKLERAVAEAKKEEHRILQNQAFYVLKTAKAVGEWSEMRVKDIEEEV